jgi:predicted phosphodiesterase
MFGVIADIHGNAWALEAVISDAHRTGVSEFVDLGDVLYGPLAPRKTFELLMQIRLVAQVRGNQDRLILDGPETQRSIGCATIWVASHLIGWRPTTMHQDWLLCHGSPSSDIIYLLEDVSPGFARVRSECEIEKLLGNTQARGILCGHTHIQRMVRLTCCRTIVNPGSVGSPAFADDLPVPHVMESGSPHARYAIIEGSAVCFVHVEYGWNDAAMKARELGREDWARGIATGRLV